MSFKIALKPSAKGFWPTVKPYCYSMETSPPTVLPTQGQLQRQLSQQFQRLYREQLNHCPGKITCQIIDEKLLLLLEDSVTKPEQLLMEQGESGLAEQGPCGPRLWSW